METYGAPYGREFKTDFMKKIKMDGGGLICIGNSQMQCIMGGTTVACIQGVWDYIKKAFDFIMEYHHEIIKGFRKGWNNL